MNIINVTYKIMLTVLVIVLGLILSGIIISIMIHTVLKLLKIIAFAGEKTHGFNRVDDSSHRTVRM